MKKNSFVMYRNYIKLLVDTGLISVDVHNILFHFGLNLAYAESDEECFKNFLELISSQSATIELSDLEDGLSFHV